MRTRKNICALLTVLLWVQTFYLPVSAQQNNSFFVQTARLGSSKIIKDSNVYDMYQYTAGQAVLHQDASGTIYVPIRIIAELAGLSVDWNDEEKMAAVTDPVSGSYWKIGIGRDFAMKYNASGELTGQHWMYKPAELRNGITYITLQDIQAIYGYQVYERIYEGNTYVIVTNYALALSYSEITELCQYAADKL